MEPIKTREGRLAKKPKPPRREVRRRKDQATMDAEFIKAKERFYTIFFRKEGTVLKITLSESSLKLLDGRSEVLGADDRTQEKWDLLCWRFDQHGLVNHRTVKDPAKRLEMIHKIFEEAIREAGVETITRRSWMSFELSEQIARREKLALAAHEGRRAEKRRQKVA